MRQNPQLSADLILFIEEVLSGNHTFIFYKSRLLFLQKRFIIDVC